MERRLHVIGTSGPMENIKINSLNFIFCLIYTRVITEVAGDSETPMSTMWPQEKSCFHHPKNKERNNLARQKTFI